MLSIERKGRARANSVQKGGRVIRTTEREASTNVRGNSEQDSQDKCLTNPRRPQATSHLHCSRLI